MQIDFFQVFDDMVKEEAAAALEAAKQAQAQNSQLPKDPEPVPVLDPEPEPDPAAPTPAAAPQGDPAGVQQPQQG